MAKTTRREPQAELKSLIAEFQALYQSGPDRHAIKLLQRLCESREAAVFFEKLRKRERDKTLDIRQIILRKCIQSEQLVRNFPQKIVQAKAFDEDAQKLRKKVEILRRFVDEVCARNHHTELDLLAPFGQASPEQLEFMRNGLRLIESEVSERQIIARDEIRRFGATRKVHLKVAAENAAIRWLAASVREVTGKPFLRECADLCEVVLQIEVTLDRLRNAAGLNVQRRRS